MVGGDAGHRAEAEFDRAQLILIGALIIALTIVGSVVLLNSIHVSADVTAQQERQNLEQAERVTGQVQEDIEELFLVYDSVDEADERLPFIDDESGFEAAVRNYSEQYMNVSTRHKVGVVSVEYDEAASTNGTVLRQNETAQFRDGDDSGPNTWNPFRGAEDFPYVYLNITSVDPDGGDFTVRLGNGGNEKLDVVATGPDEAYVEIEGTAACGSPGDPLDPPIEIELVHSEGQIRTGERTCLNVEFGKTLDADDMQFQQPNRVNGTYLLVGTGSPTSELSEDDIRSKYEDVIVEAVFQVQYTDPTVQYEANTTVLGGGS